jgi:hypothetical protein
MRTTDFLTADDAARLARVLAKLARHGVAPLAVTGGVAIEARLGAGARSRALADLDVVSAVDLSEVGEALADDFLFVHLHPHAPGGKIVVQLVDPAERLRVDVFRPKGAVLARATRGELDDLDPVDLVAIEDLAARVAGLVLDLGRDRDVPRKHAEDFGRLVAAVDPARVEPAWRDHRRAMDPPSFAEAVAQIADLVVTHADRLIVPVYSRDISAICDRCAELGPFRPAAPADVLALLGYC